MISIPERTALGVVREFGEAGKDWLATQPGRLAELGERWQLTFGEPFDNGLPINMVFRVTQNGQPLVLKTGYPHPEMYSEMAVLERWRSRPGCVQLIDSDKEVGAVLMRRVMPGTGFRELARTMAEKEASTLVRHLFEKTPLEVSPDDEFPTYQQWCARAFGEFRGGSGPAWFADHIASVESLLSKTAKTESAYESNWLLHGDLHHENILVDDTGDYIVVDPKGVIGPRLFEYGRYVHNFFVDRLESMSAESILMQRTSALRGEFSEEEILMVGYIDLVLACCWTLNSGEALKAETIALLSLISRLVN